MDKKNSHSIPMTIEEAKEFILHSSELYYHNISVDTVIIGYHDRTLKILLEKPQFSEQEWMLPGGYIRRDQTAEEAAEKTVQDRTRLKGLTLQQYMVYSSPGRTWGNKNGIRQFLESAGIEVDDDFWMFDKFLSIGFFALTEYSKVEPSGDLYAEECKWFSLDELPPLIFNHRQMIEDALHRLRHHIVFHPIGYSLLPDKFTLPEILSLYETILGKTLDGRNFTKKLTKLGIIVKTNETRNIGAHRSPFLYVFDKAKYDEFLEQNEALIL